MVPRSLMLWSKPCFCYLIRKFAFLWQKNYNYKRRQYDETLSATGGCTTANDVVILQTVPVPKVTLLWRHETTRQTRTRWRRVKTLGQHQVGVNLQSHAQHQLWISTWHIFHEFHKIMPGWSYPVSLVNQNVILVNISHWRLHMAWIMSLMST